MPVILICVILAKFFFYTSKHKLDFANFADLNFGNLTVKIY